MYVEPNMRSPPKDQVWIEEGATPNMHWGIQGQRSEMNQKGHGDGEAGERGESKTLELLGSQAKKMAKEETDQLCQMLLLKKQGKATNCKI